MTPAPTAGFIELRVDEPGRLFEPFDASPLVGRHLDEKVERFIVHAAKDRPAAAYRLALHVQGEAPSPEDSAALSQGIREHFAHRAQEEDGALRALIHEGRRDLLIGLGFLFICGMLGLAIVEVLPAPGGSFIEQGLLIIGWVALWRPVDLFLFELRPLRHRRDLLTRLSLMDVRIER